MTAPQAPHIVVVGGGLSGLTTAYRLLRANPDHTSPSLTLLEAGRRLGGKLHTIDVDGLPVEAGADSFVVRKPWGVDLCRDLGLENDLVVPGASGAYVWTERGLTPFVEPSAFGVPAAPGALLRWNGISLRGRMRGLLDLYKGRRRRHDDEPLGQLLRRRLGREAAATLVEPLLAGLHAADPDRLSVLATFPELSLWERRHGSLVRGARAAVKASRGSGGPMFATVWGGLSRLTSSLEAAIGENRIRTDAPVGTIERSGRGFIVDADERVAADAVVLATPAFETARLLRRLNPDAAERLAGIRYASTASVILVYPPGTGGALPEGTGFVVPSRAQASITACTWLSRKWPSPTYGDKAVIRCFVGRDGRQDALELEDDALIDVVRRDVEGVTSIGAQPTDARVVRWPKAMPQYDVGHLDRLGAIEQSLKQTPGVFLVGSAYRGVGIADCIRQSNEVAEWALRHAAEAAAGSTRNLDLEARQEASRWRT